MALVSTAEVQAWVAGDGASLPTIDATLLTECIAAAGELIVDETSRVWEVTTISDVLDGDSASGKHGQILFLRRFPVTYPTDPITITENGVALTVGAGYSTSANVIVKNAGAERTCQLIRQGSNLPWYGSSSYALWSPGCQNITVSYKAGYTTIPTRIKSVAKELAWLIYQRGRYTGVELVSAEGTSRKLISSLSDFSQAILADARRF